MDLFPPTMKVWLEARDERGTPICPPVLAKFRPASGGMINADPITLEPNPAGAKVTIHLLVDGRQLHPGDLAAD